MLGSRKLSNLRPEISDTLPEGFNTRTLEVDEENNTCIVEVWCSDHDVLPTEKRKKMADLVEFGKDSLILETVKSHRNSPKILASLSVSKTVTGPRGKGKSQIRSHMANVDLTAKQLDWNGKRIGFLRKKQGTDTKGRKMEEYVLDEG